MLILWVFFSLIFVFWQSVGGTISFDLYLNKIIQGDCLQVMQSMPEKSVDMVLCDLPYGMTAPDWDKHIGYCRVMEAI